MLRPFRLTPLVLSRIEELEKRLDADLELSDVRPARREYLQGSASTTRSRSVHGIRLPLSVACGRASARVGKLPAGAEESASTVLAAAFTDNILAERLGEHLSPNAEACHRQHFLSESPQTPSTS